MVTNHFETKILRPAQAADWLFLRLPAQASERLPTRAMCSVEGTINGQPFAATLQPDGQGGHWLKIEPDLATRANLVAGGVVSLEIQPAKVEPEPHVPEDIRIAIDDSGPVAQETWAAITAKARRDWIAWITSGKKEETRVKRLGVALDKLGKGDRRPCCFDRSGMYDGSLSCPIAAED